MDFSAKNDGPGMTAYRSTSLFQPHRARQAIRDAHAGKIAPLMGMYLGVSTVPTARFVAPLGYDAVWVDWEHSSCGVETMTTMVHEIMFMSEGRSIPFVRVPGHDHAAIGFALDAGASIICPQVDTVEQAKHIVSAAKFGAKINGTRSAPPFRLIPGVTDIPFDASKTLHENLNEQAAIVIQIETVEGINNLDAILTECPEIDCVWFGTLDCRISMGLPGNMGMGGGEPEWLEAQAKYNATMKKHNKPSSGFALGPPQGMAAMGAGKSFIIVAADVMAIAMTTQALTAARDMFPASSSAAKAVNGTTTNGANGASGANGANAHVSSLLDDQSIDDHILITFPFPVPPAITENLSIHFPKVKITHLQMMGPAEPEAYLAATVLVTWGSLPPTVESCRNLRFIHFLSAGVDQFLTHPVFTSSGVPITNSSGIHGPPIAEWVFMMALNFTRKHSLLAQWQVEKHWAPPTAMLAERDMYGQRIGILGYGAIGQQIGRVAKSMGMVVVAFTRSPRSKSSAKHSNRFILPGTGDPDAEFPSQWYHGTDKAALHEFLSCGLDIVVLAMALTPETKAMIGAEELALLRKHSPEKTVFLVNIARGGVIDESALIDALEDSKDGITLGAALDVTEREPLPKESRLWEAPNCFITPHISSVGKAYFCRSFQILEANLRKSSSDGLLNKLDTAGSGY